MGKSDYITAKRILALVADARAGHGLTIPAIKKRFAVEKATAGRYLRLVRDHVGMVPTTRGGRKMWNHEADNEVLFQQVTILELAIQATAWLRDTQYHRQLNGMLREKRGELPGDAQDALDRVARAFHFKRREPIRQRLHVDVTERLMLGIRERRRCRVVYQNLEGEESDFMFEPWSFFLARDSVYVVGNKVSLGTRTLDLCAMRNVEVTKDRFLSPSRQESDLTAMFAPTIGSFSHDYDDVEQVVLRVRKTSEILLRRRPLHSSQALEPTVTDGWATARMSVVVCPELVASVLALLPDVRVDAPASLRQMVREAAAVAQGSEWDPRDP